MTMLINTKDSGTAMDKPYMKSRATGPKSPHLRSISTSTSVVVTDVGVGRPYPIMVNACTGNEYDTMTKETSTDCVKSVDTATQMAITSCKSASTTTTDTVTEDGATNTPQIESQDKDCMVFPATSEKCIDTEMVKTSDSGINTTSTKQISIGLSPISIPCVTKDQCISAVVYNTDKYTSTSKTSYHDTSSDPIKFPGTNAQTMTNVEYCDRLTSTDVVETKTKCTGTLRKQLTESGTGSNSVFTLDKEIGTPHIHFMHKNVSTDNMLTADKQTNTSTVSSAYRQLIDPRIIMRSKGTSTEAPITNEAGTLTDGFPSTLPIMYEHHVSAGVIGKDQINAVATRKYVSDGNMYLKSLWCKSCRQFTDFVGGDTGDVSSSDPAIVKHDDCNQTISVDYVNGDALSMQTKTPERGDKNALNLQHRGTSPIKFNNDKCEEPRLVLASYQPPILQSKDSKIATIKENTDQVVENDHVHNKLIGDDGFDPFRNCHSLVQTDKLWTSEPNLGGTTFVTVGRKVPSTIIMKIDKETNTSGVINRSISTCTANGDSQMEDKGTSTEKSPPVSECDPVGGKINECIYKLHNVTKRLQYPTSLSTTSPQLSSNISMAGPSSEMCDKSDDTHMPTQPAGVASHVGDVDEFKLPRFSPYLTRRRFKSDSTTSSTPVGNTNVSRRLLARKLKLEIPQLLNSEGPQTQTKVSDTSCNKIQSPTKIQVKTIQRKIIPSLEDMLPSKQAQWSPPPEPINKRETQAKTILKSNNKEVDHPNNISKSAEDLSPHSSRHLRDLTAQLRRKHASTPQLTDIKKDHGSPDQKLTETIHQ